MQKVFISDGNQGPEILYFIGAPEDLLQLRGLGFTRYRRIEEKHALCLEKTCSAQKQIYLNIFCLSSKTAI